MPESTGTNFDAKENAREYYGQELTNTSDLKTTACCTTESIPDYVKEVLVEIHAEVLTKYYGCGTAFPPDLHGLQVLDLGLLRPELPGCFQPFFRLLPMRLLPDMRLPSIRALSLLRMLIFTSITVPRWRGSPGLRLKAVRRPTMAKGTGENSPRRRTWTTPAFTTIRASVAARPK